VGAIGAGVSQQAHLLRQQRAVAAHARLHANDLRMARAAGDEFLFARVLQPHRPVGLHGQVCADVLDQHLLLDAEAAADTRLDHAYALGRQTNERGNDASHVIGHLRAGAHHQPVVLVPVGDGDMRLDRRLLHLRHAVLVLDDEISLGKTLLDVTDAGLDVRRHVALDVVDAPGVRFVVNDGCARLHRILRLQDGGQNLVFHLDQVKRALGDLKRLGSHGCHAITDEAHLVVETHLVVWSRLGPRLAGGGVDNTGQVGMRQHGMDAGQRTRFAGVDAHNAGMRMRAEQELRVE